MRTEHDEIIVGAGSTGAVLAARLSEDPERRVLLLEAGPDYPSLEALPRDLLDGSWISIVDHDWGYQAEAVPGREIHFPRGRVTGGSSAVNAAIAIRGVPADYDEWAALGNAGWSWAEVLPYFKRLEADQDAPPDDPLHGHAGPIPVRRWRDDELKPLQRAFREACLALGFAPVRDHNDPEATGVGPWPMNVRDGVRVSTALAYLLPARGRPNLTILAGAHVARVLFEGTRAVGVEFVRKGAVERTYAARVTLSAGAIATPAILLRSGVGPAAEVAAHGIAPVLDLPGVGRNLIDHPHSGVLAVPKPGVAELTHPTVQMGVRYTAPGSAELNDMQLYMIGQADLTQLPTIQAMVGSPIGVMVLAVLQRPRSRGRVTLRDADPKAPPRIELGYLSDPEDMRRMVEGVRLAWRVARSPQVAALTERIAILQEIMLSSTPMLQGYINQTVNTLFHPVGTARMGPAADLLAVVDARGDVHGLAGLSVADASIMPTIPRANTNLTCIMLGEWIADLRRQPTPAGATSTATSPT